MMHNFMDSATAYIGFIFTYGRNG